MSENVRGMSRPLLSTKGGKVRTPKLPKPPKAPAYHLPAGGMSENVGGMSRRQSVSPPIKKTTVPPPPGAVGGAASGSLQDANKFIQSLLVSTDPAAARALIDQVYAPVRQDYTNQINALQSGAQARAAQMQQVYGAFAQYMGGLQGNLNSIYQAGHADGSALTSGMSGPTGGVGTELATMAGAQNTKVAAEGKAWGDFGASMPGVYSLMATQQVKQMLNAATASEEQLRSKLLDLSSQEASQILSYLSDAQAKDTSLKEWAYQQTAAQASAKATSSQNYLNYLQREKQIEFEQLLATNKFTEQQAMDKVNADYKAAEIQARQQGLIDTATYQQGQLKLGAQRVGISQQQANTAKSRAQQAMLKANRLVPAPDAVSRSAGRMQLYNPASHTYVDAVGPNGKVIPYKGAAGTSSKTPGTAGFKADLQKQKTKSMSDATSYRDSVAKQYYIHKKGVTISSLDPAQKAYVKAQVATKFMPTWLRIAKQMIGEGLIKGNYTPRQLADYWLNQSVRY